MAPHSSTVAWKMPWMEEPGRLQSMGSLRVGDLPDPGIKSVSCGSCTTADTLPLSHQGSPVSGIRKVRSLLESAATSHEKRGLWCLLGTVADTLFTVSTKATSPSRPGLAHSIHS